MTADGREATPRAEGVEIPGAVVREFRRPTSVEEVETIVAEAAAARTGLLIAGGRTRLHQANPAQHIELGLSLRALDGIDEFAPEEGVVHARAGTPIRAIQTTVGAEGWELPLDPPGADSTLGGTLASAASGPRAHAFGRPRDAILGLEVVTGDGVSSKCGGRVVKNVTGYDMAKLYCGSFGSLAVVTGAWLRLRPKPAMRCVLVAQPRSTLESFETCRWLCGLGSVRAFVWDETPGAQRADVTIELGGSAEGVAHDRERISGALAIEAASDRRIDVLRDARAEAGDDPIVLRARVLGTQCGELAREILDAGLSVSVDPGLGVVRAAGALATREKLLAIRESARRRGGFATFEVLPDAWRANLDVFGEADGTAPLLVALKQRFDPAGVLNPGRYVGGI